METPTILLSVKEYKQLNELLNNLEDDPTVQLLSNHFKTTSQFIEESQEFKIPIDSKILPIFINTLLHLLLQEKN